MEFNRKNFSDDRLLQLHRSLVLPRLIEEKMLNLLRLGKISKWFSGIGQEAISVGVASALNNDEYILPLMRNLGVFTSRNISLKKLFAQFLGKQTGFTKGRDRTFHFGTKEHHIVGMISHLGPQLAVADGIALYDKIHSRKKVTAVFTGDGGTSEGDFHESLNVASVWKLPVIFIIENNGYGLSTTPQEQYNCKHLVDRAIAYGIKGYRIDGNNILEVHETISKLAEKMRQHPEPVLIEAVTFRMRGHEEASGTKYVPKKLFEEWGRKDPILNFENFLREEGLITLEKIEKIKNDFRNVIEEDWFEAEKEPEPKADSAVEEIEMYAPHKFVAVEANIESTSNKRFVDAVSEALNLALQKFGDLIIMGQDIAEYGGVFKITEGFAEKFGKGRIRNTPICESAILGSALGYSIQGGKAIVEMQFADFVSSGFTPIVNNLAKVFYRWGQNADVVVRMPTGAGVSAGPFHSQSNEAWFTHVPGLKVVYPSSPWDAKGLLLASIEDPNPILFFEHKALYRSLSESIPGDYYTIEIGKGKYVQYGHDATIITYGMGVEWCKNIVRDRLFEASSIEIIDLRTLIPWDKKLVEESVKKTGKVLIVHEDTLTGGIGGEISAWITEHLFEHLDAPIMRAASLDTAVPLAPILENNFLPVARVREKLQQLLSY